MTISLSINNDLPVFSSTETVASSTGKSMLYTLEGLKQEKAGFRVAHS